MLAPLICPNDFRTSREYRAERPGQPEAPLSWVPQRMATKVEALPARSAPTIVIRPTKGPIPPRISELWAYRELFAFLVWRDIKVRYAQTVLGAVWTVFQPLAMMLVYTYAFTQLARIN